MPGRPDWEPLLKTAEAARVWEQVFSIAQRTVEHWSGDAPPFGLLEGAVGYGFAFAEWTRLGVPKAHEALKDALEASVAHFNQFGAPPGLHTGIAGLGWLAARWGEAEELASVVDEAIVGRLSNENGPPLISLREGLAGLGAYAAFRRKSPRGEALAQLVRTRLLDAAAKTPLGMTWDSLPGYCRDRGLQVSSDINTGVREWGAAHGVSAVLLALAQLDAPAEVRSGLRWLWASTGEEPNRFGWIEGHGPNREPLNLFTWCTGDIGVGLIAWLTAARCQDTQGLAQALGLGVDLARRVLGGERPAVVDRLDLCCGLAGAMHCFTRWYQGSGTPLFADASRALAQRLLAELASKQLPQPGGLQFGLPGICLALQALVDTHRPAWDLPFAFGYADEAW